MRFAVLGSGSSGNSVLVETQGTKILIDAGFSARELVRRLAILGVEPEQLSAILLTHEHGDHIKGLEVFCKRFPKVVVMATGMTRRVVEEKAPSVRWANLWRGERFEHVDLQVDCFAVTHDAVEPVGFVLRHIHPEHGAELVFGLLTDTGYPSEEMLRKLRGVGAAVVEANYDEKLLEGDLKRPFSVKQRIAGRHGHLSNEQAGDLLAELSRHGLGVGVLAHLSKDCNEPSRAMQMVRRQMARANSGPVQLHCACQLEPSAWIDVPPVGSRLAGVSGSTLVKALSSAQSGSA